MALTELEYTTICSVYYTCTLNIWRFQMVQNVYIAKAVEELFKREPNKSGLINDLLLMHYGKSPSSRSQTHYPERREQRMVEPMWGSKTLEQAAVDGDVTIHDVNQIAEVKYEPMDE